MVFEYFKKRQGSFMTLIIHITFWGKEFDHHRFIFF